MDKGSYALKGGCNLRFFFGSIRYSEQVDPAVTAAYRLSPILTNHYDAATAARQKLEALQSRKAPQARDVFDLHLLRSAGADIGRAAREAGLSLPDLQARVMDITQPMFVGQVLAYLPPEEQARYADPHVWDSMVLNVADALLEESAP